MKMRNEKQKLILRGILDLISSGEDIYRMKVSDIAKAAGMGKGTVYDYFDTKEEMITQALLYSVEQWLGIIADGVSAAYGFKNKFYAVLKVIEDRPVCSMPAMRIISSGEDLKTLEESIRTEGSLLEKLTLIYGIIDDILETGVDEGTIGEISDRYYGRSAVMNAVVGFMLYISNKSLFEGICAGFAKDTAYRLVVNSLGGHTF